MSAKRMGDDEGMADTGTGRRPDLTPLAFGALRAAEDGRAAHGKEDEKLSVFWRVFGGTILSICALVAITLYNNLNSTITDLRSSVDRANEARSAAVNDLRAEIAKAAEARATAIIDVRAEMAKAAEARAELIRKDEINPRITTIHERIQGLQTQNNAQNATLTSVKTELDGLKDRANKAGTDLDAARKDFAVALDGLRKDQAATADALKKDQSATTDALKKDIAAMEGIKDRLATLCGDLKSARDDLAKLQKDADRNGAYDLERKTQRDAQYKQFTESLKELQHDLQGCREKLARMEGQYAPPGVTAAGGTVPAPADKPAPAKKAPARPEAAPTSKAADPDDDTPEVGSKKL